jgi:hypothetical protein
MRQMGVAQWEACGLGRDLGVCLVNSSRGLRIIGPMQTLVSPSDSILVSLLLYFFKFKHFNIYVFLL